MSFLYPTCYGKREVKLSVNGSARVHTSENGKCQRARGSCQEIGPAYSMNRIFSLEKNKVTIMTCRASQNTPSLFESVAIK